jgi:ubiquinone/menaquinone biosynthesis C-methylase UbiE
MRKKLSVANDKELERKRYNDRAGKELSLLKTSKTEFIPIWQDSPYRCFSEKISTLLTRQSKVLEIGAGTGLFTKVIASTGADVIASDIAGNALKLLKRNLDDYSNIDTLEIDMESLPFEDASFDAVVSAGSLSYGDNLKVLEEIYRVLKIGGVFISVDSLNHNPVYRFNRYRHYLKKERTKSTLKRLPNLNLISMYGDKFKKVEVEFFGSITWLMPILTKFINEEKASELSKFFDKKFRIKKSAFKFVMVAWK